MAYYWCHSCERLKDSEIDGYNNAGEDGEFEYICDDCLEDDDVQKR